MKEIINLNCNQYLSNLGNGQGRDFRHFRSVIAEFINKFVMPMASSVIDKKTYTKVQNWLEMINYVTYQGYVNYI